MKTNFVLFLLLSILFGLLVGCATQTVTITVEPQDAKIYVDGEYVGEGQASFEAGLRYDFPKTHTIQFTHKDFESFQTEIRNKLDVPVATGFAALTFALGVLEITLWATELEPRALGNTNLYLGIGTMLISPTYYLMTYKFKDVYSYDLR